MALKDLVARLQSRAADPRDTPEKNMGYQEKVSVFRGCTSDTPDTPCFADTRSIVQIDSYGEAANDAAPEPPTDTNAWRELAAAYNRHHFGCPTCIAAGCGAVYGMRCRAGAALWRAYGEHE